MTTMTAAAASVERVRVCVHAYLNATGIHLACRRDPSHIDYDILLANLHFPEKHHMLALVPNME